MGTAPAFFEVGEGMLQILSLEGVLSRTRGGCTGRPGFRLGTRDVEAEMQTGVPSDHVRRGMIESLFVEFSREEDFQRIFEHFYHPIAGFFSRRGFSPDECRDLAQETFLRAYKSRKGYRSEAAVKTWIFTIATNIYRNEIRSRRAEKRSADEISLEEALEQGRPVFARASPPDGGGETGDALEELLVDERVRLLRDALEGLPPRMRRCVRLSLDHDLKYREIAVILQISEDTVKAQLFQARQRLHETLGEYFDGVDF